jgi:hypothetical protein
MVYWLQFAIIDIADRDRPSRQRAAEPAGKFQRRAGVERGVDRLQIGVANIGGSARGGEGQARGRDDAAVALETEAHRHLHAGLSGIRRRRRPAGAQFGKQVADIVEVVVGLLVFGGVVLRRHTLDRQLQVFAIGIIDLGNAGSVIKHAAERRRARPAIEHAAGRMGKRRGIDLMAVVPNLGRRSGSRHGCNGRDETDKDAPEHGTSLQGKRYALKMRPTPAGIKPRGIHIRAFEASSPGSLDRATQYPRDVSDRTERRGVQGPPVKPWDDNRLRAA